MSRLGAIAALVAALFVAAEPAPAQLRGHGGPVRALTVSADGSTALSGSFDTSAIRWSLRTNSAEQVLRFHDGPVNAVALLKDATAVTAGDDAHIALGRPGEEKPALIFDGHTAPVAALAVSPDGSTLASASWDRTVRLWPLAGGPPRVLEGHQQNGNGVAFAPDGKTVVSAGYDATLRIWPLQAEAPASVLAMPTPLNTLTIAPDGEIVAGGADGKVYFVSPDGARRGAVEAAPTSIIALALSSDGERVAAAAVRGPIAVLDRKTRRLVRTLVDPGLPVWSLAFLPGSHTLLTGGTDRIIRRWDTDTGAPIGDVAAGSPHDPLAAYAGDPDAQVFRACVACHTLKPEEGNRAGPSLHGIFGRRIASLPGYHYSEAFRHLDIVWTPETVAKLFEVGPNAYTPGTKMPEQRIGNRADRDALIRFLQRATR